MSSPAEVRETARELYRLGLAAGAAGAAGAPAAAGAAAARGAAGAAGAVSVRDGEHVHIAPVGHAHAEPTESDVVTLHAAGGMRGGPAPRGATGRRLPPSEYATHLAVYAARPDVAAIVHSRSGHATAWTTTGAPLETEAVGRAAGGSVRVAPYAPSAPAQAGREAVAALADRRAALLAGHGALAVGPTAASALGLCSLLEREARVAWLRRGLDAHAHLAASVRPLVLGIGGGGDVVGALATAELCRLRHGARPVLGGVSWERRPIDPWPGPRTEAEIQGARRLAPAVFAASSTTRVHDSGVLFAESRVAGLLAEETVLVDPSGGPAAVAAGLAAAMRELGCDLALFIDVGGDALAHGDEPGLGSPLCDAVMLAAAVRLQEAAGPPVLAGIFGVGCDGELTPAEVFERLDEVGAAGGRALPPPGRLDPEIARRVEEAVRVVPTEASAMALRAYHGESGTTTIRGGRRAVELTAEAAETWFFDPTVASASAARLAAAVRHAPDLEAANEVLRGRGIRTELDYERDAAHTRTPGVAQQ